MAHAEEILGRIGNAILHHQTDIDDILIAGQHQRLGGDIGIARRWAWIDATEADLYALHLGHLWPQDTFERIGPMPMKPWVGGSYMLAKAQHDPSLVWPNSVGTAGEPHHHDHANDGTEELRVELAEPQRR